MKSFGVTIVLPRFIRSDEVRAFEMSVLKSFCGGKLTLAQSVERLTAEREVVGSIPGIVLILRVLKYLRNEGTSLALQTARASRGSDNHVKWQSRLQ